VTLLLDTSVLVALIRQQPPAMAWIARQSRRPLAISSASVLEIERGVENDSDRAKARSAMAHLVVIGMDEAIAARAGAILRRYQPSHGIDIPDAIIAATSLVTRTPLRTHNLKHFPMLDDAERPF
jgi:hypothetical protein